MVERKYTDPVDGPNLDEHPELEVEEAKEEEAEEQPKRRRTPRRRHGDMDYSEFESEPDPQGTRTCPDPTLEPPKPETDWADKTDRNVTARGDQHG